MKRGRGGSKRRGLCVVVFLILWILSMCAFIYHCADFTGVSTDPDSLHLISYVVSSVEAYRQKIRGLDYQSVYRKKDKQQSNDDIKDPCIFKLKDLLDDWNPDDTHEDKWITSRAHPDQPNSNGNGVVRRFDYSDPDERSLALKYREAELPFIVYNVKELNDAVPKFSAKELLTNFGHMPRMVERSSSNHFMYYTAKVDGDLAFHWPTWRPPQIDLPLTFAKFLRLAEHADQTSFYYNSKSNNNQGTPPGNTGLHYLTISAHEGGITPWIANTLPYFSDRKRDGDNFFIVDADGYHGINCRFGMRGVIAEAHFDGARNFVSMIRGRKRYILLPPSECDKLSLYPRGHPSARHTKVDWSDIQALNNDEKLANARATEAIISSGDVLYIPSFWFHYIMSQDASIQCNARSGSTRKGEEVITHCMSRAADESYSNLGNEPKVRPGFEILTEAQV
jgi:hypothetical protein